MKPLFVLLIVFGITAAISKVFYHQWNSVFAGNLAMSIMLFFTAMAHLAFKILAGVGLLVKPYRHTTAVLLVIFFILILPANVYAAIHKVDYEKGNYSGNDLKYLWFRIPLQIFFIEWVWYFGI